MAAMFSILGIYLFVKGRLEDASQRKIYYSVACFISCFLAIMSKQNAVLVVPSLVLVEMIFFERTGNLFSKLKDNVWWLATIGVVAILIAVAPAWCAPTTPGSHAVRLALRCHYARPARRAPADLKCSSS